MNVRREYLTRLAFTGAVLFGAFPLGCRPRFSSGVDPTKRGSELSSAEVQQLCEAGAGYLYDSFVDHRSLYCNLIGIGTAASAAEDGQVTNDVFAQTACIIGRTACEQQDIPERQDALDLACADFTEAPNCESLVGDIETCAGDTAIARFELAQQAPDCGDVTLGDLTLYVLEPPASCDEISANCPEATEIIFGGLTQALASQVPQ